MSANPRGEMPAATEEEGGARAVEIVCESIDSGQMEKSVKAKDDDLAFLSEFLGSNLVQMLVEAHDTLDEDYGEPIGCDNIELVRDVLDDLENTKVRGSQELHQILNRPHFKALIEAHDDIAAKNYESAPDMMPPMLPPLPMETVNNIGSPTQEAIRMVGIRKNSDEPLGITVTRNEHGDLAIVRIMAGGAVDNQGLLHVGDVIKEINGQEVNDPDQLQEMMKRCSGSVTLKVIPSYTNESLSSQVYLKAHFNYEPKRDNLIPCRDAGLPFKEGDILQVLNMEDNNWWQAKRVDDNDATGLIPSQMLEEKRKAFVRPEYDYTHKSLLCGLMTKKKKKLMYQSKYNNDFDRTDLMIYEEVQRMPPFQRKCLVLVGSQGVGRRTLKQRLIKADSTRFGEVIPHTSRPIREGEVDGDGYWYVSPEQMEHSIKKNHFIEHGQFEGHYYGTKYDSIRNVIRSGRMCILDLSPAALKAIRTAEFMPYIVFLASPPVEILRNMHELAWQRGKTDKTKTERDFRMTLDESKRIERTSKPFFDLVLVNDNVDETYNRLRKAIETLCTEPQWVPVSWVF